MWRVAIFLLTTTISKNSGNMIENVLKERSYLINKELKMMVGSAIKLSDNEWKANQIIMALKIKEVKKGFVNPQNYSLSKHFFQYKDKVKKKKLYQLIQKMPKGAILHGHDTAMLSPDYVLGLTYWENLYVCFKENNNIRLQFSKVPPAATCGTKWQLMKDARFSSGDVEKFDADLKKHFSMVIDNPYAVYTDVNTVWKKFSKYFITKSNLFSYKPVWEQYFYDTLKALKKDNIMYFEIRSVLPSLYDLEGNVYDSVATAEIYKKVTEQFMADYPDFLGVKLIYAPLKLVDKQTLQEYIKTAKEIKSLMPDFLAGFDLVGQEDLGVPLKEFMSELAEARKELDLFLHAGESNWYGTSSDENLFDAIVLGTKRIGHAFAINKHPLLIKEVKRRRIALEVNVLSNSVLKLVDDVRNHPLAGILSQDLPVVLSSDDPGVWEADPLSHDFYIAFVGVSSCHADLRMLKQLALNSLLYSTYPNKKKLVRKFENRWTNFIDSVVKNQW